MKCPRCDYDNGKAVPVKSCRCGYNSTETHREQAARDNGKPGTELQAIIPKLFANASCGCARYAARMDDWGVDGCQERREEIVAYLMGKAKRLKIPELVSRPVAGRWLDKAIRRAKEAI